MAEHHHEAYPPDSKSHFLSMLEKYYSVTDLASAAFHIDGTLYETKADVVDGRFEPDVNMMNRDLLEPSDVIHTTLDTECHIVDSHVVPP